MTMAPWDIPGLRALLLELLRRPGPSGWEQPLRDFLTHQWRQWAPEVWQDTLGNVYARLPGHASHAPCLMVTAHMDTIGLVVSRVQDGWLWIRPVGGVDPRVLLGQQVWVWGTRERPLLGVITMLPEALRPEARQGKPPTWEDLRIDVGLPPEDVAQWVPIGAPVTFATPPQALDEHLVTGPGLDNRASLAALSAALALLTSRPRESAIVFVATVQEETNLGGAQVAAQTVAPDVALVVDVTFGQAPGTPSENAFPLGEGITLGWGAHMHPEVYRYLAEIARHHAIPYTMEPLPVHSGTEARVVQLALLGIPTGLISLPLRYMHTPVETVDVRDILAAARLLEAYGLALSSEVLKRYQPTL